MHDLATLEVAVETVAIELTAPDWVVSHAELTLSPEERDRARRFQFPFLRQRYALSHACLRILISGYLGARPQDLHFTYNRWGKPSLCGDELQFNLSHSGEMAAYAFTRNCPVGVDVEQIRPVDEFLRLAERFFAVDEFVDLIATQPDSRLEAFFRCWTRKEAFIKALGQGLSYPLDRFRVSLNAGQPALLSIDKDTETALEWLMCDLQPVVGYIGCIAVQDPLRQVRVSPTLSASRVIECEHLRQPLSKFAPICRVE